MVGSCGKSGKPGRDSEKNGIAGSEGRLRDGIGSDIVGCCGKRGKPGSERENVGIPGREGRFRDGIGSVRDGSAKSQLLTCR